MLLPIGRFFNAIQYWCTQRAENVKEWLAELDTPFEGTPARANLEAEREMDDFRSFAGAFGIQPPKAPEVDADVAN